MDGHSLLQLEADDLELHVELLLHLPLQDNLYAGMNFPAIFQLEKDLLRSVNDGSDFMKKEVEEEEGEGFRFELTKIH